MSIGEQVSSASLQSRLLEIDPTLASQNYYLDTGVRIACIQFIVSYLRMRCAQQVIHQAVGYVTLRRRHVLVLHACARRAESGSHSAQIVACSCMHPATPRDSVTTGNSSGGAGSMRAKSSCWHTSFKCAGKSSRALTPSSLSSSRTRCGRPTSRASQRRWRASLRASPRSAAPCRVRARRRR